MTTRSTTRPRRPPPSVRGIHLDGTRLDLDPDPREEHAVSSSLIRCNWQGLRPWNLPFQAIVQRGEEDYPGGGQERVTCPRHLQFFFSCPGEMPSRASHRPVREKWSKNFLEINRTRLLRLSGHGWYVHHRVVDKLSSYRPLTGHIFSPPFKYFLRRIRNSRNYSVFPSILDSINFLFLSNNIFEWKRRRNFEYRYRKLLLFSFRGKIRFHEDTISPINLNLYRSIYINIYSQREGELHFYEAFCERKMTVVGIIQRTTLHTKSIHHK